MNAMPFIWVVPVIGFLIGLGSPRLDGKRVFSLLLILIVSFGNLLLMTNRLGRFDPVMSIVPPLATILAFFVGLTIRRLVIRR